MLFVLLFMAANLAAQAFVKDIKKKNAVMLAFSLVFYAWAGVRYVALLLGLTWVCWRCGLAVERATDIRGKRRALAVAVTLTLVTLGVFKYTGFVLQNVREFIGWPETVPEIVLPVGLSFYSFQLISYVADVYRGRTEAQKKYWLLLLYAGLFHQCVAGPIVRYSDVNDDILHRRVKAKELSQGIGRFCVGLAKKAVLANGCATVADSLLVSSAETLAATSVLGVWLGAFAYTLQIYLDFSAYSDMAIGMGLMCGFHYKENFNYPYMAGSVTDFWRRWHISLSSFFRDYVYISLGGNRCGTGRQVFNMLVVWGLTGLWHGAGWNYILWGLYYFVFLVLEKHIFKDNPSQSKSPLRHMAVLVVVCLGWVLFKFEDFSLLTVALKGLVGGNGNALADYSAWILLKNNLYFLLFCCVASTPLFKNIGRIVKNLGRQSALCLYIDGIWEVLCPVLLLVISMMALAGNSYNPFLYFQF